MLSNLINESESKLTMIIKWGCDGASEQSRYKQGYCEITSDEPRNDSFLFVVSLVPLQLKHIDKVVWDNPRPSSTRYCRPIKFLFAKETAELTRIEVEKAEKQIKALPHTKFVFMEKEFVVEQKMVDRKVCSVLANQSFQKCYICGVTSKDMNDLASHAYRTTKEATLTFGLSSLYSWIRCFECLLHIAYRLEVKTWQVKNTDKERVE
jgi:hypothetical protein